MVRKIPGAWGTSTEVFDVYSADFREVIDTKDTMEEAKKVIDTELFLARACPSCEE